MRNLKFALAVLSTFSVLTFVGCSKEEDDDIEIVTESCKDGIKNQNETGIDCGGVCKACVQSTKKESSFTVDGSDKTVTDFDAHRTPNVNPRSLTLIAVTDEGNKLTIHIEEPAVLGWSDGLNKPTNGSRNYISYLVSSTNGSLTDYSTMNGNGVGNVAFFRIKYAKDSVLIGNFSGDLEDVNGNVITISKGRFDSTFDD